MNKTSSTPQHHLTPEAGKLPVIQGIEKLIPLPEVRSQTGFGNSFLYSLMKEEKFPKPVKIGASSRWRESEVQQWIQDQIENNASAKRAGGVR